MLAMYRSSIYDHCGETDFEASEEHFLCRECCQSCASYDLRTVGLFKEECRGVKYAGLCSKTYVVRSDDGLDKFSCKGIQKKRLDDGLVYEKYKNILTSGKPYQVSNVGFRHMGWMEESGL